MKRLLGNLPVLVALGIMTVFSTDVPIFASLKTEFTYGLWVAVLVPAAVVLLFAQILMWIFRPWARPFPRLRKGPQH